METNSEPNWHHKVALNKKLLYPYSSYLDALQAYLHTIVQKPIAKLLYAIEQLSATNTLFLIDRTQDEEQSQKLLEFWTECFMDPTIVNIDEIPEPKPNEYSITTNNYELEFPFSFYLMKRIDSFKQLFEEEMNQNKECEENIDPQTGEFYQHFLNGYIRCFSIIVKNSIPLLKKSSFNLYMHLYFNDYVTIISSDDPASRNPKDLALSLKRMMGENKILDPIFLHAFWWRNSNTISSEYS